MAGGGVLLVSLNASNFHFIPNTSLLKTSLSHALTDVYREAYEMRGASDAEYSKFIA